MYICACIIRMLYSCCMGVLQECTVRMQTSMEHDKHWGSDAQQWEEDEQDMYRVCNRWTCFQYKCLLHLNVILITKITSELNLHKIRNV